MWLAEETGIAASAAEGMEKPEPSCGTGGRGEGGPVTLEGHLEALKRLRHRDTRLPSSFAPSRPPKEMKLLCPCRNLNVNAHSFRQVEVTQCQSVNR